MKEIRRTTIAQSVAIQAKYPMENHGSFPSNLLLQVDLEPPEHATSAPDESLGLGQLLEHLYVQKMTYSVVVALQKSA